jgi:prepilin-type N-terminal cleavage/methylation domain-containing protein
LKASSDGNGISRNGFTLAEVLITLAISGFLFLCVGTLFLSSQSIWLKAWREFQVTNELDSFRSLLRHDLRNAYYDGEWWTTGYWKYTGSFVVSDGYDHEFVRFQFKENDGTLKLRELCFNKTSHQAEYKCYDKFSTSSCFTQRIILQNVSSLKFYEAGPYRCAVRVEVEAQIPPSGSKIKESFTVKSYQQIINRVTYHRPEFGSGD